MKKEKEMKTNHHQFCTALLVVTVSGLIMSLTGCTTVMTGKYQSISVTSDPPDSASYKKQTQTEPNAPITKSLTVIQCGNCGHEIGRLERAYVHEGHIVCSQCYLKLKQQP